MKSRREEVNLSLSHPIGERGERNFSFTLCYAGEAFKGEMSASFTLPMNISTSSRGRWRRRGEKGIERLGDLILSSAEEGGEGKRVFPSSYLSVPHVQGKHRRGEGRASGACLSCGRGKILLSEWRPSRVKNTRGKEERKSVCVPLEEKRGEKGKKDALSNHSPRQEDISKKVKSKEKGGKAAPIPIFGEKTLTAGGELGRGEGPPLFP